MKKLFKEVNKIYSISHEILKAEYEYKDEIKNLTEQEKELLRGFEGSMRLIID